MAAKSQFLQIRVTAAEKATLQRLAAESGQDVSAFVLSRALPAAKIRFAELVEAARREEDRRFVLAELNDLLSALPASAFADAVANADLRLHRDFTANYIAAMVEHAAVRHDLEPPKWTRRIEALERPYFAADLPSLRPWLLAASPAAFKRRNIFIDSSLGDRV